MEEVKKQGMESLFCPYEIALELKELEFDEPCLGLYREDGSFLYADVFSFREPYSPSEFKEGVDEGVCYINSEILEELVTSPTFSQAINFLYICSNKQIDIELKASDTYEERFRKVDQGCEDLWNLQNSKSN